MTATVEFGEFIRRVRAGDEDAATELVRRFEPLVRREVRLRLGDSRVRRAVDDGDVCQSVLASFFARAAGGQFDLADPTQLAALLVRMARNKAATAARTQTRQRRDCRRATGDAAMAVAPDPGPTPSRHAAGRELFRRFRELLTDEERAVADLRAEGREWAEIAARLGGTADGRRIQFARAVRRVAQALGFDGPDQLA